MTEWVAVWIDTLDLTNLADETAIASLTIRNTEESTIIVVTSHWLVGWTDPVIKRATNATLRLTSVTLLAIRVLRTDIDALTELKTELTI